MKRFALWALLAASLSANLAVALAAVRHRSAGTPDEPVLFSKVALDAAQRDRISKLRSQILAKREEHGWNLSELRVQLAAAIVRQPEDRAAIDSTLRRIAESQARFQEAVVDHVLAVRSVLRPEQRPAFEDIVAGRIESGGPMQCGFGPDPGASRR